MINPKGKEFPLELWSTVSSGFSSLGSKAEWRIKQNGGKADPIALIVRYNVSEDPATPTKITSYLVVSKISTDGICVTDIVKPGKDANQQARGLADAVADKTCLNHGGEPAESSPPRSLTGTITGFECGDNCYLSIRDQQGADHTGLCAAPLCDDWNNAAAIPDSLKGKRPLSPSAMANNTTPAATQWA
ncbi:MAG: hypothetical protein HZT40_12220 [Candidatus Thiothrix singaporensis]|uniref:Uncharacterized protein n=1 Tax=Candidatus Thiothrix singaporensis TaxID=2799669 RepID=A0A7L6AT12_9GAMM|nr:MAG: hypothetical protein HZT40_12220 [Candidatus Thiothrix singaporensis]